MTDYELTRRDTIAALAASGVAVGGLGAIAWSSTSDPLGDHELATLQAVARTIYPSEVSGIDSFVERVVAGRVDDRPEYAAGVRDAVAALDEHTQHWEDADYVDLPESQQAKELREFGVHFADPDPDGDEQERVRYFLVNELLYALYTSPTGGELVGIENPQGHPGGTASYQRLPFDERSDGNDDT